MDSSLVLKSKVTLPPGRRVNLDIAVSLPLRLIPPNVASQTLHGVAVVDTGASMSLVCKDMLTQLGAIPHSSINVAGIHGDEVESDTFLIDLHFVYNQQTSRVIQRLEVATLQNSTSLQLLLGMDVLTKHVKRFTLTKDEAELHF